MSSSTKSRFLIFYLGEELYGTPLLEVRELIEPQKIKPMPNSKPYFLGVTNVRGSVIGVIDLCERYGVEHRKSGERKVLAIFETEEGPISGTVDQAVTVLNIDEAAIEVPTLESKIPMEYFIGVAKTDLGMINLVSFSGVLGKEKIVSVNQSKMTMRESA